MDNRRRPLSPTRTMARWGRKVLLAVIAAVLIGAVLTSFVPSLHAYRRITMQLLNATLGVCGLVTGFDEWGKWYGKVGAIAGALMLFAFFLAQLPGRFYIMTASTTAILIFLIAGYGRKERGEKGEG